MNPFWLNRAQALRSSGNVLSSLACRPLRLSGWYSASIYGRLFKEDVPTAGSQVSRFVDARYIIGGSSGRYIANDSRYLLDVNTFLGFAMNL